MQLPNPIDRGREASLVGGKEGGRERNDGVWWENERKLDERREEAVFSPLFAARPTLQTVKFQPATRFFRILLASWIGLWVCQRFIVYTFSHSRYGFPLKILLTSSLWFCDRCWDFFPRKILKEALEILLENSKGLVMATSMFEHWFKLVNCLRFIRWINTCTIRHKKWLRWAIETEMNFHDGWKWDENG